MLNAINTKILVAILAALGAIGALLIRQQQATEKAAAAAAKTAAILQQQEQDRKAQEAAQAQEYQQLQRTIQREHQKHANDNKNPSKTWQHYIP